MGRMVETEYYGPENCPLSLGKLDFFSLPLFDTLTLPSFLPSFKNKKIYILRTHYVPDIFPDMCDW